MKKIFKNTFAGFVICATLMSPQLVFSESKNLWRICDSEGSCIADVSGDKAEMRKLCGKGYKDLKKVAKIERINKKPNSSSKKAKDLCAG